MGTKADYLVRQWERHGLNNPIEPVAARHVAGQAAMLDPRIAHLVSIFTQNDKRGQDAMLTCGVFNLRFKKEL